MEIIQYTPGMMIEPGQTAIVAGMPNDVYHSHPHLSSSSLALLNKSPAHFKYAPPRESTSAMAFGSAVHAALLEPEYFKEKYVLLKDVKDRRSSEYKEAVKVHGAEFVLLPSDADKIRVLSESVMAQDTAAKYLTMPGHRELSFFTKDHQQDVPIRCRFDMLTNDLKAIDLKTTRDARPDQFSKSVLQYGYHIQNAFYEYVFECATLDLRLSAFKFIAVESDPPHPAVVYELDQTALVEGNLMIRELIDLYSICSNENHWPSYDYGEMIISLPDWKLRQIENELQEEII